MSEDSTGGAELGDVDDAVALALAHELEAASQQPDHPYDSESDPDGGAALGDEASDEARQ